EGISQRVDAFSRAGQRSIIVLNDKTSSRSRWDIAHELGHLVMHAGQGAEIADGETQADAFAAAFLMPAAGFASEFPSARRINWEALSRLKARWRVSLAAMIRRAVDLRIIDAMSYRYAYKVMSMRGWLKLEPYEFQAEEPELIGVALNELYR